MSRLADLDALTLDANGTLVGLVDPVPELARLLRDRNIVREPEAVRRAFEAEGRFYRPRSLEGRDARSLETLQRACAGVFLAELEAELDAAEFAPIYVAALTFAVLPGVSESLARLRARGLELAVIANWDLTLEARLEQLGLGRHFSAVISSAEAGSAKPDPGIFALALDRLRVRPERTLHVGDGAADEEGARAAGLHFAWAPLPAALEDWF